MSAYFFSRSLALCVDAYYSRHQQLEVKVWCVCIYEYIHYVYEYIHSLARSFARSMYMHPYTLSLVRVCVYEYICVSKHTLSRSLARSLAFVRSHSFCLFHGLGVGVGGGG